MNLLPFDALPGYKPRRFVRAQLEFEGWEEIAPLFDQLEMQVTECKTAAELERWLLDWSELSAALDEEAAKRYIAMTCHTDNPDAEKAYLHFVEKIDPQLKPRQFKLAQLYVEQPLRQELSRERFGVFDRDTKVHVELFRPDNVPLETEEAKLSQQYQKLSGSLTVQFRGEEKTLVQMGRYLEEPDRALRQEAWELVANRRLQEREKFEDTFDQLVQLRQRIAKNAGFENYRDYAFRKMGRFDYTPDDCAKFHDAVEAALFQRRAGDHHESAGHHRRQRGRVVPEIGRGQLRRFIRPDRLPDDRLQAGRRHQPGSRCVEQADRVCRPK